MPMPNINNFMMVPNRSAEGQRQSVLSRALRDKKKDEQHGQTMDKLSEMIRELRVMPHAEHAGGG